MTMASAGDPLIGHVLDGRYEIIARIARGGMATVYRAMDRRLTRTVAVKVMHDGLGDDAEFTRKFDREARSAAKLSNPHVVGVFDQGHDAGRPYIVMEFVQGCTLRHIISRDAPLEPLRALELMEPVASALASAHESGLVHRDVKPENVLISDRGEIKVGDFGLARALTAQSVSATQGLLIGTVSYLPPELVTTGRADPRGDVYSAGVVLFEMLTGVKPHTGETPIQVAYSHVHSDIPAPSTLLAKASDSRWVIPGYLDALVVACTRRQPADRPKDGRQLLYLIRQAKHAVSHGVLDDPRLTELMSASTRHSDQAFEPTLPAAPASADTVPTQVVTRPTTALPAPAAAGVPMPAQTVIGPPPTGAAQAAAMTRQPRPVAPFGGPVTLSTASTMHGRSTSSHTGAYRHPGAGSWSPPARTPVSPIDPPRQFSRPTPAPQPVTRRDIHRRRRGGVLLVLVMLLAALVAIGSYLEVSRWRDVATPTFTGLTRGQAQDTAAANHVSVAFDETYSDTVTNGLVIRSDPQAGQPIRRGGTVTAWLSLGPQYFSVPTLIGLSQASATTALTDSHLSLGTVTQAWSSSVASGNVLSSSPVAGTLERSGTRVSLVVSKGPQPIPITSYVGKRGDAAVSALKAAGFSVTTSQSNSATVASGSVISQTPASGTGMPGDTITLVISKGPVMVQVPSVFGRTQQSGVSRLTSAGFKVKISYTTPSWMRLGLISLTVPGGGSMAAQGSTITVYVS